MPTIRKTSKVGSGYTQIHNSCFRGLLSAVEVAILGHGLSHIDGWEFHREDLDTVFEDIGKTRLEKALKGLRLKGFLEMTKLRDDDGCFEWEWDFTADPTFAAARATDNPDGNIVDLTVENAKVTPQPQNEGVVPPAETPGNGQIGAKPDTRFPGYGERGSGGSKEENPSREQQTPPYPPSAPNAGSSETPNQGGEIDPPEQTPAVSAYDDGAIAIWRTVLGDDKDRMSIREKRELVARLAEVLASGCESKQATDRLSGVDKAHHPFAAACARLRGLETEYGDPHPQNDPFASEPAPDGAGGTVPPHCGQCSGGPARSRTYRHKFNLDGSIGAICECNPAHPLNINQLA